MASKKDKKGKAAAKESAAGVATDAKAPTKTKGAFEAFDIESPELPEWIAEGALTNGDFPYERRLKRKVYQKELRDLQIELLKLQHAIRKSGERIVVVFEGRDAAGKGGCIADFIQHLNPRHASVAALAKPTDVERGQWYFQRYVSYLPTAGDMTLFDRSWYNRAGVERVMGFAKEAQIDTFLAEAPAFENLLVRDGIRLFKIFLAINRETQLKRFHSRYHDPLKQWKLTEIDMAAIKKWDAYTAAQRDMFKATHSETSPWTVIRANDKLRTRLNALRIVLSQIDYEGKNAKAVGMPDPQIVGSGPAFFDAS